jgi:hypothetical protein
MDRNNNHKVLYRAPLSHLHHEHFKLFNGFFVWFVGQTAPFGRLVVNFLFFNLSFKFWHGLCYIVSVS